MKVSQFYLFFLLVLCLWEVPKDCPGCSFCQRKNVKGAPDQPRRKTPTDSFVTSCVHLRLGRLYHEGEPWWTSNLRHTTGRCGKRLWPFQGGRDGIHKWVRSEACGAGVWIASDIFVNAYAFFLEQQPMQWEFSTVSLSQPLCQYFCRIYIYTRKLMFMIVYVVYLLGAPFAGCKCYKCSLPPFLTSFRGLSTIFFNTYHSSTLVYFLLLWHHSGKQNLVASSCNLLDPQL
jgi:hypothetical protein